MFPDETLFFFLSDRYPYAADKRPEKAQKNATRD